MFPYLHDYPPAGCSGYGVYDYSDFGIYLLSILSTYSASLTLACFLSQAKEKSSIYKYMLDPKTNPFTSS